MTTFKIAALSARRGPRRRELQEEMLSWRIANGAASTMADLIYHICKAAEWDRAGAAGCYGGSSQDEADGFIHFSTAAQVAASAAKHRAGQDGLMLIEVDAMRLGPALKWETSRGGQAFPHLYGPLPLAAVTRVHPLPLGRDGRHVFPWGLAG
jgi:uncharacterized protein (DUF952 family)